MKGDIKITLEFYMPKCNDMDNFLKILFDSLIHNDIIEDDRNILEL